MRAMIASSATGGHIYPALAIAEEIKKRDAGAELLFVGAKWEIGKDIVKSAGYKQAFIDVSGIDRRNPFKALKSIAGLARASGEIKKILKEFNPDICIGTGGHVSGAVIRIASKAGIRTIIQEQNVMPGMANKLAEKYAGRVFVGFDDSVWYFKDRGKVAVSGNPVRAAFSEAAQRRAELRRKYGVADGAFCVLFFGGSQGADAINDAAAEIIEQGAGGGGEKARHYILITGRDLFEDVRARLAASLPALPERVALMDYSEKIYELYAAADLIVARAGALTVTEIAAGAKASILIPSPNVTNNHQYYNAKTLADAGAAVLLLEERIQGGELAAEISRLADDPEKVKNMGIEAGKMAKADAAAVIVDEIFGS